MIDNPPYPIPPEVSDIGTTGNAATVDHVGSIFLARDLPAIRSLPTGELQQEAAKRCLEAFLDRLDNTMHLLDKEFEATNGEPYLNKRMGQRL
jgi:hypothetical protein